MVVNVKIGFNYVHLFITYLLIRTIIQREDIIFVIDQMYEIPIKDYRNKYQ